MNEPQPSTHRSFGSLTLFRVWRDLHKIQVEKKNFGHHTKKYLFEYSGNLTSTGAFEVDVENKNCHGGGRRYNCYGDTVIETCKKVVKRKLL